MCFLNLKKQTVEIEGMHCEHCAAKVKNALTQIEGVKKVEINLDQKCAFVYSKNSIESLLFKKAIEEVGFKFIDVK